MPAKINTIGTSTQTVSAELAIVFLDVRSTGTNQSSVSEDVNSACASLKALLQPLTRAPETSGGEGKASTVLRTASGTDWTFISEPAGPTTASKPASKQASEPVAPEKIVPTDAESASDTHTATLTAEPTSAASIEQESVTDLPTAGSSTTLQPKAASSAPSEPLAAPIVQYSMSSFYSDHFPIYNNKADESEPRGTEYTSSASFEVHFRDSVVLGQVVADIGRDLPLVSFRRIDWQITDETRDRLGKECRKAALREAMAKAADYGEVLGLDADNARVVEVNDVESVGEDGWGYRRRGKAWKSAGGAAAARVTGAGGFDEGEPFNFTPPSMEIECTVKASFEF